MKSVLAILGLAVAFILISVLVSGPKNQTPNPQEKQEVSSPKPEEGSGGPKPATPEVKSSGAEEFKAPREGVMTADLTIKGVGTLTCEFYPKAAPNAVKQITGLIKSGFYDGIKIHRVEKPVVVQF